MHKPQYMRGNVICRGLRRCGKRRLCVAIRALFYGPDWQQLVNKIIERFRRSLVKDKKWRNYKGRLEK